MPNLDHLSRNLEFLLYLLNIILIFSKNLYIYPEHLNYEKQFFSGLASYTNK